MGLATVHGLGEVAKFAAVGVAGAGLASGMNVSGPGGWGDWPKRGEARGSLHFYVDWKIHINPPKMDYFLSFSEVFQLQKNNLGNFEGFLIFSLS